MGRIDDTVWCDGCGIEILLAPTKRKDYEFCCQGCADGLPCWCGIFLLDDVTQQIISHANRSVLMT
jgi:hypothetical protein